jgi:hypothetical protein
LLIETRELAPPRQKSIPPEEKTTNKQKRKKDNDHASKITSTLAPKERTSTRERMISTIAFFHEEACHKRQKR